MSQYRPNPTTVKSVSVAADLELTFATIQRWVDGNTEISLSRYLITAAYLCQRLGITDPGTADINALWSDEIYHAREDYDKPPLLPAKPTVTLDTNAKQAFDKLF